MRTLIGPVIAAAVLTGSPALAAPGDPAPGVRAPGSGRLVAPVTGWSVPPGGYGSAPRPREPKGSLTLSYLADSGFAAAVKLTCEPTGGGHPRAAAACATLKRTGADPSKITPASTACILLYAPVIAELTGTWHGTTVTWTHRFGNSCEMRRATGVLFQF